MLEPTLYIAGYTINTFAFFLWITIAAGAGIVLLRAPDRKRGYHVDALLVAFFGALVLGRVGHVLLNWAHFQFNIGEITQIERGGLDWHGAVVGAFMGLWLMSRWRGIELSLVLDRLALIVPLMAMAAWAGCIAADCAYGAEVDTLAHYPPITVWEAEDLYGIYLPRFNPQLLGIISGGVLFIAALGIAWLGWFTGKRIWLILLLLSIVMFVLGFLRGDYAVIIAGLRLDQWFDSAVALWSITMLLRSHAMVGQSRHM